MLLTRKPPTIQDVARHAKVSAATVSRTLSNPERVSEATRTHVKEAIRQTGYTINQAARSLRRRAASAILVALPDIGNPFYSTILDAVVDEATSRGYAVLVVSRLHDNPARMLGEYFLSNRADGLLLFDGSLDIESIDGLRTEAGPVPLVVSYDEIPNPAANAVGVDNLAAAMRAVEYLVSLGHRAIGHIIGPSHNQQPNPRLVGFRHAMVKAGLPIRPEWLPQGDYSVVSGVAAAEHFLAQPELPTAIFSANDEMAIGLIATFARHGVACPRDISVVGFDDIAVSQHFSPPLTTMRQPRDRIGRLATQALIDILEGETADRTPIRITLASELVVRDSTAPLRSGGISRRSRAVRSPDPDGAVRTRR